jgi:hypothetical protein
MCVCICAVFVILFFTNFLFKNGSCACFWQIAKFDGELFFLTSLKKRLISANIKDLFFCFSFLNFLRFFISTFLLSFKNVGVKNL